MKVLIQTLLLLFIVQVLKAQKGNPFERIGKHADVHTLSSGKYEETFDNDTLQRIGSVLIDIRTRKIVGLLNSDSIYQVYSDNTASSRWYSIDPLAEKYAGVSPYVFVDNDPILKIDPDGRDWVISTSKNKDGSLHYNITFQAAIMNSSSSKINMKGLIANEMKVFEQLYGVENVTAKMELRQISSMDDLKGNEHLIEIMDPSYFNSTSDGYTGGQTYLGGKFIAMNARAFDAKTGLGTSKGALSHEIGHTGGLLHPFDFGKEKHFLNGNLAPTNLQGYTNSENDIAVEANFMNYASKAASSFPWGDKQSLTKYFMNNPTSQAGQVQQVIQNYNQGNLNNGNDVSARAILHRINNLFGVK